MKPFITVISMAICLFALPIYADHYESGRIDAHAPIGVMADHTHEKGEWMTSIRYMPMNMNENQLRRDTQSISEVLTHFMMAPLDMSMNMLMVGAMTGISETQTLMVMIPYTQKNMDIRKRDGSEFSRSSAGIGDLKISLLHAAAETDTQKMTFQTGISVPLGSVDETDGQPSRLPYPMQLGSGTVDLLLGMTTICQFDDWSWGHQFHTILRTGQSKHGYRLSNQLNGLSWMAKTWSKSLSTSIRLSGQTWGDIKGSDPDLNPMMVPTATQNTSGKVIDLAIGINYQFASGILKNHRIALEYGTPVYQYYDHTQMSRNAWVMMGWQVIL